MEISHWHLYVVVNCGLIIPFLFAKPFSLNKAIAEEALRKQEWTTVARSPDTNSGERTAERFSLNNALSTNTGKTKGPNYLESIIIRNKKLASIKNIEPFHIKTPLKKKKLKFQKRLNLLHKKRNQSKKRDIYNNGKIDKKYVPLLRNLGVLFDNILHSESRDTSETIPNTIVKNKPSGKWDDVVCTCTKKSESRVAKPKSSEKAASVSKPRPKVTTQTTIKAKTPTTTPYPTSTVHISSFRSDKIISLLPTRNTTSIRRNHNGFGERSRAALHASIERDISRDHGNSEHDTRVGENWSSSTNNKKNTVNAARDDSSSDGPGRRIHGNRRDSGRTGHGGETKDQSTEINNSIGDDGGNLNESQTENKHETRGDKAKNRKSVPKLGESLPTDEGSQNAEFVQSKENCEENIINIAKHSTSSERLTVGDGPVTTEDQETGPTNEAIITIKDLSDPILMLQSAPKNLSPHVTIIDGYSIARDKNGQNKISEKTIRYQSKT